jgi:protein-L-isoaspartate(D-aspartate) O-methyltransferase
VHCRQGDGSRGWPEAAPFKAIVVGARAPQVPQALVDQLAPGGRLVIPLGSDTSQTLYCITKDAGGALHRQYLERVLFVPLVAGEGRGAAGG